MQSLLKASLLKMMVTPEGQEAVVLLITTLLDVISPIPVEPEAPTTSSCECDICVEAKTEGVKDEDTTPPEDGLKVITEQQRNYIFQQMRAAAEGKIP